MHTASALAVKTISFLSDTDLHPPPPPRVSDVPSLKEEVDSREDTASFGVLIQECAPACVNSCQSHSWLPHIPLSPYHTLTFDPEPTSWCLNDIPRLRPPPPLLHRASPLCLWVRHFQGGGVSDQPVEGRHHVAEPRPVGSLLLPAVQHERVQGGGALRRRGKPVVLLDGVYHLMKQKRERQ